MNFGNGFLEQIQAFITNLMSVFDCVGVITQLFS